MYARTQTLLIKGELPSLNEYINACRSHYIMGSKMKKEGDELVQMEAISQKMKPIKDPCYIKYVFYCKNRKKDKSNVSSMAIKCIEDGLQQAGILAQDNWEAIDGFSMEFFQDKLDPRVEVTIRY